MGDPHQMVVHHVGEVVGGVSIGFNEDHIIQLRVIHTDIAVNVVVEGGGPLLGVILTDHEGHSGLQIGLHLFLGKAQACLLYTSLPLLYWSVSFRNASIVYHLTNSRNCFMEVSVIFITGYLWYFLIFLFSSHFLHRDSKLSSHFSRILLSVTRYQTFIHFFILGRRLIPAGSSHL